ncbi:MAG: hypothetical protein KGL62_18230, partial [Bradyrhizobium sp.]|uniref:hypothetical protein n=1 Tax=Bradyrhizobium sp. TaxID=376 RepID=UPI00238FD373
EPGECKLRTRQIIACQRRLRLIWRKGLTTSPLRVAGVRFFAAQTWKRALANVPRLDADCMSLMDVYGSAARLEFTVVQN